MSASAPRRRANYTTRVSSNTANARLLPLAAPAGIWFHRGTGCCMPIREPDVPDEHPLEDGYDIRTVQELLGQLPAGDP